MLTVFAFLPRDDAMVSVLCVPYSAKVCPARFDFVSFSNKPFWVGVAPHGVSNFPYQSKKTCDIRMKGGSGARATKKNAGTRPRSKAGTCTKADDRVQCKYAIGSKEKKVEVKIIW